MNWPVCPGQTVLFPLSLANLGNQAGAYQFDGVSSLAWSFTADLPPALAPAETFQGNLSVMIPEDAHLGDRPEIRFWVISLDGTGHEKDRAEVNLTVRFIQHNLYLALLGR